MTGAQRGFLLLTSHLGDPMRKPLTVAQLRRLSVRAKGMDREADREMEASDLIALGYDRQTADRILHLLSQEEQLDWYLGEGRRQGCVPVTRVSQDYPAVLRSRLGLDSPGSLWAKGDLSLLKMPMVALVGSREPEWLNDAFAREAGRQAALQGYALVSGNARGADRAAQDSCLEHGGRVISVVADELRDHSLDERILYLSEDGFDSPFSAQRALSRNRVIHCLPRLTLVAQCRMGKGGTWDGTTKNLLHGWSPVFCLDDGTEGMRELEQRGAVPINGTDLEDLSRLQPCIKSFIDTVSF